MTRFRTILAAAASLVAVAGALPALAAPAEPIKNVVLVHGAFADGSGWRGVYDILKAKGYRVSIVQEPETSLADDIAATNRVIDQQDGPVVLVGHSWGGQIITDAGVHPKVKALVYVAALAPDVGESTASLQGRIPPATKAGKVLDGYVILDPAQFHADFAADLPKDLTDFMAASQVLIAASAFDTPAKAAAWKNKPSYGIVATEDRAIHPDLQRWMYKRAGGRVTEVSGSHAVYISQPKAVADVIERAATGAK
jgi:pimeloyl-ACP methyl ester carboxylesterase